MRSSQVPCKQCAKPYHEHKAVRGGGDACPDSIEPEPLQPDPLESASTAYAIRATIRRYGLTTYDEATDVQKQFATELTEAFNAGCSEQRKVQRAEAKAPV